MLLHLEQKSEFGVTVRDVNRPAALVTALLLDKTHDDKTKLT
jgi:hypothetical protein